MKIQRAIMSTDANPEYYHFWPSVAKKWKKWDIVPTLVVISEEKLEIDESLGEVIYVTPEPTTPTAQQAQIARLFGAASFEDEICLISDIDMMPLKKEYFVNSVKDYDDEDFVAYSSDAYVPGNPAYPAYPMCYLCSKGSNFKQIIGANLDDFHAHVKDWLEHGFGWYTDEKIFYKKLQKWQSEQNIRLLRRGFNLSPDPTSIGRIDRSCNSFYYDELLKNNFYVDYHMPRPYEKHKDTIDLIFKKSDGC
jgi:hypothetical protein